MGSFWTNAYKYLSNFFLKLFNNEKKNLIQMSFPDGKVSTDFHWLEQKNSFDKILIHSTSYCYSLAWFAL